MSFNFKKILSTVLGGLLSSSIVNAKIEIFNGQNYNAESLAKDFATASTRLNRYNGFYDIITRPFDFSKLKEKCNEFGIDINDIVLMNCIQNLNNDNYKFFIQNLSDISLESDEYYKEYFNDKLKSLKQNQNKDILTFLWKTDDSEIWDGAASVDASDDCNYVNIDFIFVKNPGQNKGRRMLDELVNYLTKTYNKKIILTPKHERLVPFYESCGFKLEYPDDEYSLVMYYAGKDTNKTI